MKPFMVVRSIASSNKPVTSVMPGHVDALATALSYEAIHGRQVNCEY